MINETKISMLSQNTTIKGNVSFADVARISGAINGELRGLQGSHLILTENAMINGNIQCDRITIDGFVRGDITATGKAEVSGTGRVVGKIDTPNLVIDFGAYFDGSCAMRTTKDRPLKPA